MLVPRLGITTPSQGPSAREARFTCETCLGTMTIQIPWDVTMAARQKLMQDAVNEHRYLCSVGLPEDMRKYRIEYPR